MKIVLSTKNKGKLAELSEALRPLERLNQKIEWLSMETLAIDSPLENQTTFLENALLKARHASYCSGLPALSDDSGLCVSALNNEPGVFSARYAGEQTSDTQNYQKLLTRMNNMTNRDAFFYCVITYLDNPSDPTPIVAEGHWHGEILHQPEGEGGFGYDPVFRGKGLRQSSASLSQQDKLVHSHRGKAIKCFIAQWEKRFARSEHHT